MSFNSQLSPNVVKTALDAVFNQEFTGDQHPQHATAETAALFNQSTSDSSAEIVEVFKGSGSWSARTEEADVKSSSPRVANQKTFTMVNYANSIDITKNLFDDNKHGVWQMAVKNFARRARTTRDEAAFEIYRDGFTGVTVADGDAWFSDTHTTLGGATVDNKLTAALTETSLNTGITTLYQMKAQDNVIDGSLAKVLLVPPALYKLAVEITESELRSDSADNDMNVYSAKYGIMVYTSPYLGASYAGGNGFTAGSDTAWFLLGNNHAAMRYVRQGVQTDLVDYKYQRNNNYIYKGEFREETGVIDYVGAVGSDGSV